MKIHEIINEDYYAAGDDLSIDDAFNPELAQFNNKQRAAYKKQSPNGTPVVKKITSDQERFTATPQDDQEIQSPGYRGREYSKKRTGQPYDKKVQPAKYGFDQVIDPELNLMSHQQPLGSPGIGK